MTDVPRLTTAEVPRWNQHLEWLQAAVQRGELTPQTVAHLRKWLEQPWYRAYWPALAHLLEQRDTAELTRLFWERIPFGTGGRRGPMADLGSATMNPRTIAESAYGLAVYVRASLSSAGPLPPLRAAVAYDTRLRSREFAEVTASVLAAQGFTVFFYPQPRATPQLSFTVRQLHCHCGAMISASHNPPQDNGFKAYWAHGGQVLAPHDRGIIAAVDAAQEIPQGEFAAAVQAGQIVLLDDTLDRDYVAAVCALSLAPSARHIRALYTPLHGVGEASVARVLRHAGFEQLHIFEPQRAPDGRFPHVPDHLPNPERTAAWEPAVNAAQSQNFDLVLASDPDADRIAVAARDAEGRFRCLTGNQLSALLCDFALAQYQQQGRLTPQHYVVTTLVTTPLVAAIARRYGVDVVRELPVGFKHMAAVVEARGAEQFVYATEESLGYMAGNYCRDKDASLGALWTMELAALLQRQGQTLWDRLHALHREYGVHLETQLTREDPGPAGQARIQALVQRFRDEPPTCWGLCRWLRLKDYGRQIVRDLHSSRVLSALAVHAGDLLIFEGQAEDCTVQLALRPSGTEPKLKFYAFVQGPPHLDSEAQRLDSQARCAAVMQNLLQTLQSELANAPAS